MKEGREIKEISGRDMKWFLDENADSDKLSIDPNRSEPATRWKAGIEAREGGGRSRHYERERVDLLWSTNRRWCWQRVAALCGWG